MRVERVDVVVRGSALLCVDLSRRVSFGRAEVEMNDSAIEGTF